MSDIALCPVCGKEPNVKYWTHEEGDMSVYCCGVTADENVTWNQYAAAMEFSFLDAWLDEINVFSMEMWGKWADDSDKWLELDHLEACAMGERRAAWSTWKEVFK